jgi:DNA-binding transcriptional MocR family regulator
VTIEDAVADWRPDLNDGGAPAYAQIAEALAADIARGVLAAGVRLPTQRALADELGIGVGTVTRAYSEAEGRGLIEAVVGRGSFVADQTSAAPADGPIDLSHNIAPLHASRAAIRGAMASLARRADLADRIEYAPAGGFEVDRRAAAAWLADKAGYGADPRRLILTAGAQQSITVAIAAACRPGEALIVEEATWHGVKAAAAHLGLRLAPAALDAEGLTPDALERAARESGARVAYVQPFQNPTARLMSLARRQAIANTAERLGLLLIEDDLYGPIIADGTLPRLADLAPDHVAYVSGLSKTVGPGLRIGFLAPPARLHGACLAALRAVAFGPPSLGALIATHLIERGDAAAILDAVRGELAARGELARAILGDLIEPRAPTLSPHLWAPAGELDAERVAGQALRAGVMITPPAPPFVAGAPVSGVRLCLGAVRDRTSLRRGLEIVRHALTHRAEPAENMV